MNQVTERFLGLYRPFGFNKNVFLFFYTANPSRHFNIIRKQGNRLDEAIETAGLFGVRSHPLVIYSQTPITNYKSIHGSESRFNYWQFVTLTRRQMQKLHKPELLFRELLFKVSQK